MLHHGREIQREALHGAGVLGPDAFVFGEATTGGYVRTFRSAWETLLLLANDIEPTRPARGQRPSNRKALAQINLHWHDLRHEALSRLADDGVPVHELQMLAGHASITTTQRDMNARANSLAESMRQERARRRARVVTADEEQVQVG
jgi:integrase